MSWRSLDWKACAYRSARMLTSHGWKMSRSMRSRGGSVRNEAILASKQDLYTSLHPWMKLTDHGHLFLLADLRCPIQCGQYGERSDSHPHTASGESYSEKVVVVWFKYRQPMGQQEEKPSLLGLCRVVTEEGEANACFSATEQVWEIQVNLLGATIEHVGQLNLMLALVAEVQNLNCHGGIKTRISINEQQ